MSAATRRTFLGGALAATAAVPVLARPGRAAAEEGPPLGTPAVVRHGRAIAVGPDGRRVIVAHDRRQTVAITGRAGRERVLDVGGQPVEVAVSPDGRRGAVSTAFWDEPGLALLDLAAGTVLARVHAGPAPGALAFTPDGRRIVLAGGEQEGTLRVLDARTLAVVVERPIGLVPRGLALAPGDGDAAWVALNAEDHVVLVDLGSGRIRRTLEVPALPDRLAVSPGGGRLLVSHGGRGHEHVSVVDARTGAVRRHRAGRLPSAVAWPRRGRRLVALGGDAAVVALGRHGERQAVTAAPRGWAVAGRRFWTVSAITGEVSGGWA